MPEQTLRFLANGNHQIGQQQQVVDIDDDINAVAIVVDRSTFRGATDTVLATWGARISVDGGPFLPALHGTVVSGDSLDDNGNVRTGQYWTATLPVGRNRRAEITVDVLERARTWAEIRTYTDRSAKPNDGFR